MSLHLRFAATSDVGRVRRDNQDSGYAGPHLLVVADGVGGSVRGDVASSACVDELRRLDTPPGNDALEALAGAIHRAHDRLRQIVKDHPELDGTSTTVSAGIFNGTHLGVVHVGDSRGYLLRDDELQPLTTDHTLVQSLIEEGRITEEEARVHPHRNLILRAVDAVHEPEPDVLNVELKAGDRLLFCSDGCSGVLETDLMAALLGHGRLAEAADKLVKAALDAGSTDNVTVVVAEVTQDEPGNGPGNGPGAIEPLLIGAAATRPHLSLTRESTGNLDSGELAQLRADTEGEEPVDEEDLRYAPRAPRRFIWLRRIVVIALVVALIALGLRWIYGVTQDQYYVAADEHDRVAIYQGLPNDLPGISLHHVYERTDLELADLKPLYREKMRNGTDPGTLAKARAYIQDTLRTSGLCPPPEPPKPLKPKRSPTKKTATATTSPSPTVSLSATVSPSASPTTTADDDGCEDSP